MSEIELFLSEIDKNESIPACSTFKSEPNYPQSSFNNHATRPISAPTVFNQKTESFLQTDRKRPANSVYPTTKRGI